MAARITPAVAALATEGRSPDDAVDLVLELQQVAVATVGDRAERMARQKASFQALADSVRAIVLQAGGTVEGEAWINCTIKARVPARAIQRLKEADGVVAIDLPHQLHRD
jgi:hypothetical protein